MSPRSRHVLDVWEVRNIHTHPIGATEPPTVEWTLDRVAQDLPTAEICAEMRTEGIDDKGLVLGTAKDNEIVAQTRDAQWRSILQDAIRGRNVVPAHRKGRWRMVIVCGASMSVLQLPSADVIETTKHELPEKSREADQEWQQRKE